MTPPASWENETKINRLEAYNARLRAALEEIVAAAEHCGDGEAPVVLRAIAVLNDR
jgi:hypothetical protein